MSIVSVSPIAEILRHSEILAWALGEAEQAEIISWDSAGREHRLALGLGGWDNEPMMSPGVIFPGSWGNVPPGETFCCPNPTSTSGSICIDGSVPGIRLARAEDVILTFEQGKLVRREAAGRGSPACDFFDKEKTKADLQNDLNWNTIAELGIGLNPAIKDLTGNSLFDEKAQETVHIAIGNNTIFGHSIKSDIHADLVTRRPSLLLDGREVMARGRLNLEDMERDRRGAGRSRRPSRRTSTSSSARRRSPSRRTARTRHAELLVRRLFRANRVGIVRMAGPRSAANWPASPRAGHLRPRAARRVRPQAAPLRRQRHERPAGDALPLSGSRDRHPRAGPETPPEIWRQAVSAMRTSIQLLRIVRG